MNDDWIEKSADKHSPLAERQEHHRQVISCTLRFVVGSASDEMICAVREVQLSEVDAEACHPAHPQWDPQRFAPEVHGHHDGQEDVDQHEEDFVVSRKARKLLVNDIRALDEFNLLVLEHDVLVSLDVAHVDSLHLLLAVGVERQAVPADMGEEEAALEVERIFFSLSEFVVNAVNLNPVVGRALQVAMER